MSKFKYQVSVQKTGIRYQISRYQVSVSGIGFKIDLKYQVSKTQKKTRYLNPVEKLFVINCRWLWHWGRRIWLWFWQRILIKIKITKLLIERSEKSTKKFKIYFTWNSQFVIWNMAFFLEKLFVVSEIEIPNCIIIWFAFTKEPFFINCRSMLSHCKKQ